GFREYNLSCGSRYRAESVLPPYFDGNPRADFANSILIELICLQPNNCVVVVVRVFEWWHQARLQYGICSLGTLPNHSNLTPLKLESIEARQLDGSISLAFCPNKV